VQQFGSLATSSQVLNGNTIDRRSFEKGDHRPTRTKYKREKAAGFVTNDGSSRTDGIVIDPEKKEEFNRGVGEERLVDLSPRTAGNEYNSMTASKMTSHSTISVTTVESYFVTRIKLTTLFKLNLQVELLNER